MTFYDDVVIPDYTHAYLGNDSKLDLTSVEYFDVGEKTLLLGTFKFPNSDIVYTCLWDDGANTNAFDIKVLQTELDWKPTTTPSYITGVGNNKTESYSTGTIDIELCTAEHSIPISLDDNKATPLKSPIFHAIFGRGIRYQAQKEGGVNTSLNSSGRLTMIIQ